MPWPNRLKRGEMEGHSQSDFLPENAALDLNRSCFLKLVLVVYFMAETRPTI
jgi:hypothetical protein